MAVYKRSYKGYSGGLTPTWSRFLILPRYGYARIFQSKFIIMFLVACFFFPLGDLAYIYIAHNLTILQAFNVPAGRIFSVDAGFFQFFCRFQGVLAYLLVAIVGPNMVAPDLTNNALPLFFARPFSRWEYVGGKMTQLILLLSMITCLPGVLLFALQASLGGWDWFKSNYGVGLALLFGQLLWCTALALFGVAVSAWVRWKIAAGALLLGVYFAGAGFGVAINTILRTENGSLINLSSVIGTIWNQMFGIDTGTGISAGSAWTALAIFCGISVWLLMKRVRAFEVVK